MRESTGKNRLLFKVSIRSISPPNKYDFLISLFSSVWFNKNPFVTPTESDQDLPKYRLYDIRKDWEREESKLVILLSNNRTL